MMWGFSHTSEAYKNLSDNIHDQKREWLEIVYAEWNARIPARGDDHFSPRKYAIALKKAKTLPEDILADYVEEQTMEQGLCSNGGHEASCCPYHCHMLSFDREEESADEVQDAGPSAAGGGVYSG